MLEVAIKFGLELRSLVCLSGGLFGRALRVTSLPL